MVLFCKGCASILVVQVAFCHHVRPQIVFIAKVIRLRITLIFFDMSLRLARAIFLDLIKRVDHRLKLFLDISIF